MQAAVTIMRKRSKSQFVADAKLRSPSEVFEEADRIYRYHWAIVDARMGGRNAGDLDGDVTMERHQALNWLIRYGNNDWDDVNTDT